MRKLFPVMLVLLGLVFAGAGSYTIFRGIDARDQVRDQLVAQNITTPDDASIPGVLVNSPERATSMAEIIDKHARESTGGLGYAEMGRFATPDGNPAGTSNPEEALIGADGKPVANQLRNTAKDAAFLQTSLYTSVMAFEISTLVVGLGAMVIVLGFTVGGLGVALGGLAIPSWSRRLHVEPAAVPHTH